VTAHRSLFLFVGLLLLCIGCGSDSNEPSGGVDAIQPKGWDEALRLPELPDLDPDPNVVRVQLEAWTTGVDVGLAAPARDLWTYGGTLPGPLLRAKVGDRVIIEFQTMSIREPSRALAQPETS